MTQRTLIAGLAGAVVVVLCFSFYELGKTRASTQSNWNIPPPNRDLVGKLPGNSKIPNFSGHRLLTHVSVDKPVYRPQETVWARGVVLNALNQHVASSYVSAQFVVKGPKGDTVHRGNANFDQRTNTFAAHWLTSASTPGGSYTLEIRPHGQPAGVRAFEIRAGRAPRIRSEVTFGSDGYGPGDTVTATLSAIRASGHPAGGATVHVVATIDGERVFEEDAAPVDATFGETTTTFKLPESIARGVGTLSFVVNDGGVVETAGKTLPILLQTVDVNVYPEGGDLAAGVPTRVYIEAFTPVGDPADISANIRKVGSWHSAVATVSTTHEGRGVSTPFTPAPGVEYELVVTAPSGITNPVPLPGVKRGGVGLTSPGGVFNAGQPVVVRVAASKGGPTTFAVSLFRREQELASTTVDLASEDGVIKFTPPSSSSADGVLRVTVFDAASGQPVAERLVYRRPRGALEVDITPNKRWYQPGDEVELQVEVKGADGHPVSAVVGLAVTDATVEGSLPARRLPPRLPAQALLETEVARLDDSAAYEVLAETSTTPARSPEADAPLDLLLGTQGWRRFVFVDPVAVLKHAENADDNPAPEGWDPSQVDVPTWTSLSDIMERLFGAKAPAPVVEMLGGAPNGFLAGHAMPMMMRAAPQAAMAAAPAVQFAAAGEEEVAGATVLEDFAEAADMADAGDFAEAADMGDLAAAEAAPEVVMDMDLGMVEENGAPPPMPPPIAPPMEAPMMHKMAARKRRPNRDISFRVYAHRRPAAPPGEATPRQDFATTVLWHAGLQTDANGKASIKFSLSDSTTSFHVAADAFTADGTLGVGDTYLQSTLPLSAEMKLPIQVTVGDKPSLSVVTTVPSLEHDPAATVTVNMEATLGGGLHLASASPLSWTQSERNHREFVSGVIEASGSDATLLVKVSNADDSSMTDEVLSVLDVAPGGIPIEVDAGGLVAAGNPKSHTFSLPVDVMPGSLNVSVMSYPSPVASLTQALEALLKQPCGCFEQSSSTVYPLIMAQQYFKTHAGVDPTLVSRANELLEAGYKKLRGFEVEGGGFEWFGGSPAHEALTAYGALEFQDMASVFDVDEALLQRTKSWLRGRADGTGGFQRNSRALDSFGRAPDTITNAYIVWSLVTAGEKGLDKEVDALLAEATNPSSDHSSDSYYLGLVAASLYELGRKGDAGPIAHRLVALQHKDGSVEGAKTSITCSGGDSLAVEATSVSILAWMYDMDTFAGNVQPAMQWLVSRCRNGRFGNTQATVLALKAIIKYDVATSTPTASGSLTLAVDGTDVETLPFDKDSKGALVFDAAKVAASLRTAATNTMELRLDSSDSEVTMPYSMHVTYSSPLPPSDDGVAVKVTTSLADTSLGLGSPTQVSVKVANTKGEDLPMVIATVSLPGGLFPRHEHLRELVKSGTVAFYEQRGRDVVLYWRGMPADGTYTVDFDVVAEVAGTYVGGASSAYLYYTDELKSWARGLEVTIAPQ